MQPEELIRKCLPEYTFDKIKVGKDTTSMVISKKGFKTKLGFATRETDLKSVAEGLRRDLKDIQWMS